MLGGVLASVFQRTQEDEDIDEDRYYERRQAKMERRLRRRQRRDEAAADDAVQLDEHGRQQRRDDRSSDEDDERRRRHKRKKQHRHREREDARARDSARDGAREEHASAAAAEEGDYVARSRHRKAQLKAEARVPYLHGPQEDANPIMDYIIKSHKYKQGAGKARGGGLASARPNSDALSQVLFDTHAYNRAEDEKQLDGAYKQLAERGHLSKPILLSQKLSMVEPPRANGTEQAGGAQAYGGDVGGSEGYDGYSHPPGGASSYSQYSSTGGVSTGGPQPPRRPMADRVRRWEHDRFDARSRSGSRGRSYSRSRSRSRSRRRSWSRSRSRDGRDGGRRWLSRSRSPERRAPERPYERPSPTYD